VAFDRCGSFALSNSSRLLVKFATAHLGKDAGFLARALESSQGDIEGLVFSNFYGRHASAQKWGRECTRKGGKM